MALEKGTGGGWGGLALRGNWRLGAQSQRPRRSNLRISYLLNRAFNDPPSTPFISFPIVATLVNNFFSPPASTPDQVPDVFPVSVLE